MVHVLDIIPNVDSNEEQLTFTKDFKKVKTNSMVSKNNQVAIKKNCNQQKHIPLIIIGNETIG